MNGQIIQLRKGKKGILKFNHPWIYKYQISDAHSSAARGDIASVITAEGKFVGIGYYNPKSIISVRLLTPNSEPINKEFFSKKITQAIQKRKGLLGGANAYRAVFSEADGLPGLIIDIYSDVCVFQIFTLGMERLKEILVEAVKDTINPIYIYEKSDSSAREIEGLIAIKRWWRGPKNGLIEISEGKAKFYVDIENGHKTGFYLDQRDSRAAMSGISKDKKILDLFCYTGGFSINAALSGAEKVYAVDIKQASLDVAYKNAILNGIAGKIEFIKQDAFYYLKEKYEQGERFDVIIIDPPSFLKTKKALKTAVKGYRELNLTAMKILEEGGTLCTFSCSHNMTNDIFSQVLKDAAKEAKKNFTILKRCHQAKDHPIVREIPQTEYLKGYFIKVNSPLT